jgi:hypothetical protein
MQYAGGSFAKTACKVTRTWRRAMVAMRRCASTATNLLTAVGRGGAPANLPPRRASVAWTSAVSALARLKWPSARRWAGVLKKCVLTTARNPGKCRAAAPAVGAVARAYTHSVRQSPHRQFPPRPHGRVARVWTRAVPPRRRRRALPRMPPMMPKHEGTLLQSTRSLQQQHATPREKNIKAENIAAVPRTRTCT